MASTGNPYIVKANMQFSLSAASIKPVIDSLQTGLAGKKISIPVSLKVDKNITNQVTNQTGAFKSLAAAIRSVGVASGLTASKIGALNASLHGLKANLTGINSSMQSFNTSTSQFNKATTAAQKFNQTISSTKKNVDTFGYTVGVSARRFSAFIVSATAITGLAYQMIEATKEALNFDRELVRLKQVSGDTNGEIKGIADEVTRLSKTLGTSSSDLIKTATTLKQAGYSARDTKLALDVLAKTTLLPTFDSLQNTTEGLIATFSQFGEGAGALERQFGSINKVAADFAVESSDLVEAVKRAGAAFHGAGGNLNELLAIFTSIRATTRESAESIATGLRTIIARLQDPKINESLKEIGVNLYDLKGNFVGPYEAARKLHDALADIDPRNITFANVLKEIGGLRQLSRALPFITQFSKAEEALGSAMQGQGSLTRDAATAQEAFLVQITKVKEQFLELFRIITNDSTVRSFMNLLVTGLTAVNSALKDMRGLIPVLALFGAAKFIGAIPKTKGEFFRGFSSPRGYASGGAVRDPRDTVPAWLQPGEFIIPKTAAQKIGYGALRGLVSKTKTAGYGAALGAMSGMAVGNINTAMFGAASGFFSSFKRAKGYASGDIVGPDKNGQSSGGFGVGGLQSLLNSLGVNVDASKYIKGVFTNKSSVTPGNKAEFNPVSSTILLRQQRQEHLLHEFGHALDLAGGQAYGKFGSEVKGSEQQTVSKLYNKLSPNIKSLAPLSRNPNREGYANAFALHAIGSGIEKGNYGRRFEDIRKIVEENGPEYQAIKAHFGNAGNIEPMQFSQRGSDERRAVANYIRKQRAANLLNPATSSIGHGAKSAVLLRSGVRAGTGAMLTDYNINATAAERRASFHARSQPGISNDFDKDLFISSVKEGIKTNTKLEQTSGFFTKIKNYTKKLADGFKETEKGIQQISSSAQHAGDAATQGLKKSKWSRIASSLRPTATKIGIAAALIPVAHHLLTGDRSGSPIGDGRLPASPLANTLSGGLAGGTSGFFLAGPKGAVVGTAIGAYEGYKGANKENEEFIQQRRLKNFDDVRSNLQFTNHAVLTQQSASELSSQLPIPNMKELRKRERHTLTRGSFVTPLLDSVNTISPFQFGKSYEKQIDKTRTGNIKELLHSTLNDEEKATISDQYFDLYKKRRAYNPNVSREAALSELPTREIHGKTLSGRDLLGLKGGMEAKLNAYDKTLDDAVNIQKKLNAIEIQATSSFLFTIDELNQFSERLHHAGESFQQNLGYGKQIAGAVTGNLTTSPTKLNLGDIGSPTGSKIYNFAKAGGDYDKAKEEISWILNTVRENFVGEGADASENARRFADNAFTGGGQYHDELRSHLLNAIKDPEQLKLLRENKGHGKQILNKIFEGVDPIKESNNQNEKVLNQFYQQYQGERLGLYNQQRGLDEKRAAGTLESGHAVTENRARMESLMNPFGNVEERNINFQEQGMGVFRKLANKQILGINGANIDDDKLTDVGFMGKGTLSAQDRLAQLHKISSSGDFSTLNKEDIQELGVNAKSTSGQIKTAAVEAAAKLQDSIARLGKTMEETANDTTRLDAAQKKFDLRARELEGDTSVRKNFAKTLTFGSRQESMGLMQRENLVNQAATLSPEQFQALPDHIRQAVGEHLEQTQDLKREKLQFDRIGRVQMERKEFGPMRKSTFRELQRDRIHGRPLALTRHKYVQMVPKPLTFTGKQLQERLMGPALQGLGGGAGQLAAMKQLNQARMEFETASEKRRNDQLVLMNIQSKNITDQSVRLTSQFQVFMKNINQSIENQMDAANLFIDSAGELTKALSTFKGEVKIERNGKLEVIFNGFETLKQIGVQKTEIELLQKVIDKLLGRVSDLEKAPAA